MATDIIHVQERGASGASVGEMHQTEPRSRRRLHRCRARSLKRHRRVRAHVPFRWRNGFEVCRPVDLSVIRWETDKSAAAYLLQIDVSNRHIRGTNSTVNLIRNGSEQRYERQREDVTERENEAHPITLLDTS
jgi:hypothetical protein